MTKKFARIAYSATALVVLTASPIILSAQTGTDPKPSPPPLPPPPSENVNFINVLATVLAIYKLA